MPISSILPLCCLSALNTHSWIIELALFFEMPMLYPPQKLPFTYLAKLSSEGITTYLDPSTR